MNKHSESTDTFNLGTCCICGGAENVVNIIMLPFKAKTPGSGWGCFQCGLPMDGAVAVLCDDCIGKYENGTPIKYAVDGYPFENRRIPVEELTEPFKHDLSKHPEIAIH